MDAPLDLPSLQLHTELRESIVRALATRRPILHHLNADTSWLLQIPRPASAIKHGSRIYYNILIDPWFVGGQSDVARWFSQQWHAEPSAVKSIAEVEELAKTVERFAGSGLRKRNGNSSRRGTPVTPMKAGTPMKGEWEAEEDVETLIDCVAISHEFTDHCHKETLLEVHPDVPVIATEKAAALISTYSHFRTVLTTPTFSMESCDWRSHSLFPLPTWLSIARFTAPKDGLYYHSALLIAFSTHPYISTPHSTPQKRRSGASLYPNGHVPDLFSSSTSGSEAAEYVLYTPHGIPFEALKPILYASPPLSCLAFLHGLHDVRIGSAQRLNLGAENGVRSQRILRARYWIGTHDEVKSGGGLIGWFLKRKVWKLEDAVKVVRDELDRRKIKSGEGGEVDAGMDWEWENNEEWDDVKFEEVGNGESRILE
ncbi:hypothetical protein GQ43DRAFT_390251 [Delitschia confertaspora ATCC 74209]|uniref:Uncharacterized protein n=1 Tax=Delitschia confertaspora ATCC 74209 TaxID=1513339 RepID=A0A9P4JU99_9PLEO|nr:hypothetical protein GQ43DRAFT_390251 [Delitschia confertaspora ATCC 74209]